jgi:hypothetical protein
VLAAVAAGEKDQTIAVEKSKIESAVNALAGLHERHGAVAAEHRSVRERRRCEDVALAGRGKLVALPVEENREAFSTRLPLQAIAKHDDRISAEGGRERFGLARGIPNLRGRLRQRAAWAEQKRGRDQACR